MHITFCGAAQQVTGSCFLFEGFKGPIYTMPTTRDLLSVLLLDGAHLQEMEAERATRRHKDPCGRLRSR